MVTGTIWGANAQAVVSLATTEFNPLLEYVQNGASVAAVMGLFLWREMKRAERYEQLYDQERKLRIDAVNKCVGCPLLRRPGQDAADAHSSQK